MKAPPPEFCRRYRVELVAALGGVPPPPGSGTLAQAAAAAGLGVSALTRLHERLLAGEVLRSPPAAMRTAAQRRAGALLIAAAGPEPAAQRELAAVLGRRVGQLVAKCDTMRRGQRRTRLANAALRRFPERTASALVQAENLKNQLRRLSRQILTAQEDERRRLSRELHDVIAQALVGINLRLANLKREVKLKTAGLTGVITLTQRMVNKSALIIHQYARELRPVALDDLGLVPALEAYVWQFRQRVRRPTTLTVTGDLSDLDVSLRTVIFRVAQEALTNVAKHARAQHVTVAIERTNSAFVLTVSDDGRAFNVANALQSQGGRLGLLGMRERVEMVGGTFEINSSAPGGTTVRASLPMNSAATELPQPA